VKRLIQIIAKWTFIICALSALLTACVNSNAAPKRQDRTPQRIVSLAPSITETLFAIGAGDRVVGVTLYCDWPVEVKNLPKVGQFTRFDIEKMLALRPDMVIATCDAPSETINHELTQYGIPALVVKAWTVEESIKTVREIGRAVGAERKAQAIAGDMERRLRKLRERLKDSPKVKTVLAYDREPLILAGPGTFADDIIRLAGGVNAAADARLKYPRYSIERLVLRGPEVIIEAAHGGGYGDVARKRAVAFWNGWPSIPAVKSGRIAVVDADIVSRPGPRIIEGLEAVARALHPELFPIEETDR